MERFKSNKPLAIKLGIRLRKDIKLPVKSEKFSEFVGIVLGDGSLSEFTLKITFNNETDKQYSVFVRQLILELFGITSRIIFHKADKSCDIAVYSKSLVDFLQSSGLKKGNKVKNKINIPSWIKRDRRFRIACMRGLADTDGSFYKYRHTVQGYAYSNFAFCFTNRSRNLLLSVYEILKTEGFHAIESKERIYLYKLEDIRRYFEIIGSHNSKHGDKYKHFIKKASNVKHA
jgi:intein/homing endonuclease